MKLLTMLLIFSVSFQVFAENKTRKLGEFDQLLLKSKFQVSLKQGDENKVEIEVLEEGEDLENLITEVKKGVLEIYTKNKDFKDKNFHVTVYYKNLKEITVKNDGEIFTEPNVILKSDKIALKCSIGGKIKVGVETKELHATIQQGGSILLHGKADEFHAEVFTGGNLSASKLENLKTWAAVKLGGTIIVRPKEYLNGKASGGTIKYQGTPKTIEKKESLGGEIKKIK